MKIIFMKEKKIDCEKIWAQCEILSKESVGDMVLYCQDVLLQAANSRNKNYATRYLFIIDFLQNFQILTYENAFSRR